MASTASGRHSGRFETHTPVKIMIRRFKQLDALTGNNHLSQFLERYQFVKIAETTQLESLVRKEPIWLRRIQTFRRKWEVAGWEEIVTILTDKQPSSERDGGEIQYSEASLFLSDTYYLRVAQLDAEPDSAYLGLEDWVQTQHKQAHRKLDDSECWSSELILRGLQYWKLE